MNISSDLQKNILITITKKIEIPTTLKYLVVIINKKNPNQLITNFERITVDNKNFKIIGINIFTSSHYVYCEIDNAGNYNIINDEKIGYRETPDYVNRNKGYVYLYQRV